MSNVMINSTEYEIKPMRAQQYAKLANVLGKMSMDSKKALKGIAAEAGALDLLWAVLAVVTEDELIALGSIAVGLDETFVRENFSLDWVTEALSVQIENANVAAIIKNFTRLSTLLA